eukprot:Skav224523  [mRNA]  locus=scaffold388:388644:389257:+ [translate_table: standard]
MSGGGQSCAGGVIAPRTGLDWHHCESSKKQTAEAQVAKDSKIWLKIPRMEGVSKRPLVHLGVQVCFHQHVDGHVTSAKLKAAWQQVRRGVVPSYIEDVLLAAAKRMTMTANLATGRSRGRRAHGVLQRLATCYTHMPVVKGIA